MSGLPPNLNPQTLLLLQQLLQQNNAPAGVGQGQTFGPPPATSAASPAATNQQFLQNYNPMDVIRNANYGPGGMPASARAALQQGGPPAGGGIFGMPGGGRTPSMGRIPSMKKGGPVEKDGVYRLHKGERVIPAPKASAKKRSSSSRKSATAATHKSARHVPASKRKR